MKRLCVFCGSRAGSRPEYAEAARKAGRMLAQRGIELVYGGGGVGLMGALAEAALAAGGLVTGIIPRFMQEREIAMLTVTELRVVESMHERKAMMAELSDGFLALPGGFGTWDEFCEVVTWAQIGLHQKPCAILNVQGYYDPFVAMMNRSFDEGFISPVFRKLVLVDDDLDRLVDRMSATPKRPEGWDVTRKLA
jgi:uncharacterized protein (TIGR00730 family)